MICGYRAKKAGVGEAVFDLGLHTPVRGSNVFAVLKGALDAGMNIPHSESCFPSEDRVSGKLIAEYRKDDSLPKDFDEMKKRLAQELGK